MLRSLIFFLFALTLHTATAQQKKFRFTASLQYPISFAEGASESSKISPSLNATYYIQPQHAANLRLEWQNYPTTLKGYSRAFPRTAICVVPWYRYDFKKQSSWFQPYVGVGLGAAMETFGSFGAGAEGKLHLLADPNVGAVLWKHLHLNLRYVISTHSRCMLSIGYQF